MISNREMLTKTESEYCSYSDKGLDKWLKELEKRYGDTELPDSSVNIEDILKLYDDNGNWIQKDKSENMDWEALLEELEENYSNVDLPDDCPSVEEILAKYDDNGNTLKEVANGNANEEGNTNQKRRKRRRKRRKKRANVEILHSNTC